MTSGTSRGERHPKSPAGDRLLASLMTCDPREFARFLHDTIRLTDQEIAIATGMSSEVSVRRWRSPAVGKLPRNTEGLDDLRAIVGLLLSSGLLYPEEVGRFLRARNADLDYVKPLVLIGRGEFDAVREAAEMLLRRLRGIEIDPSPQDGEATSGNADVIAGLEHALSLDELAAQSGPGRD